MSLLLFAENLIEQPTATIATTATAAGFDKTRLYDRDRGPQMKANAAGQFDVDIVLAVADGASALAIINHNTGGTVSVYADTASAIGTTLVATLSPAGLDPFLGTFTLQSHTKYRLRFASFGSALQVGELLLGVPRSVTQNPFVDTAGLGSIGNVRRERSPGGYVRGVKLGPSRVGYAPGWNALTDADALTIKDAFAEVDEGAKNLLVQDERSTLRWMTWLDPEIKPRPVGGGDNELALEFEESL